MGTDEDFGADMSHQGRWRPLAGRLLVRPSRRLVATAGAGAAVTVTALLLGFTAVSGAQGLDPAPPGGIAVAGPAVGPPTARAVPGSAAGAAVPSDPAAAPATGAPAGGGPVAARTPTSRAAVAPPARRARANLPVIDYGPAPRGFPADRASSSTAQITAGLRPTSRVPVYDAPGGQARAYLPPDIRGAVLVTPIVGRRAGWVAVLLPSANRRIAWVPEPSRLPSGGWTEVTLRDQIVVERRSHRLTWLRDGAPVTSWRVSLGTRATPTPLGRTFILGRSPLPGYVYAGTDVFALGAVPDNTGAIPAGLRGAHIGIHTWYHDGELGRNTTDGCIRLTKSGQRKLLANLRAGTPVTVVDR